MSYNHELFVVDKHVMQSDWSKLLVTINTYNGYFKKWYIKVVAQKNQLRFYIQTSKRLPSTMNDLDAFLIKETDEEFGSTESASFFSGHLQASDNLISLIDYCEIKNKGSFEALAVEFYKSFFFKGSRKISAYLNKRGRTKIYKVNFVLPEKLLTLDLETNSRFIYKSPPKYLDITKALHLLQTDGNNCILKVDTFPYLQGDFYLSQNNYSFNKHSLLLGSSGCGKSKFLASFIENIYKNSNLRRNYKVVIIDPHASMENDIGGLGQVVDFKTMQNSIDLFVNDSKDVVASTELLMELFKSLIADQYNSKLERVLRHALYLLLVAENFNFTALRKLLLDLEFRSNMIKQLTPKLPNSIINFFLADFNEIRTSSYSEAISPIIAFIDEMEMLPVFNGKASDINLKDVIANNFLSVFSLDRTLLGDKVIKTIAGLVMQQLLTLIQRFSFDQHIIFVIDEVPVVENPILCRFLSEARKYNLSLVLAGQYFSQISEELKDSIFANVVNYYIFRISKLDANVLVDNINIKIPLEDTRDRKLRLLSEQNNRECVVRVATNDVLMPPIKARTLNFTPIPRKKQTETPPQIEREYSHPKVQIVQEQQKMPQNFGGMNDVKKEKSNEDYTFDFGQTETKTSAESFTFDFSSTSQPKQTLTQKHNKYDKYAYIFNQNQPSQAPKYNITNDSDFTFDIGDVDMDDILRETSSKKEI